MPAMPCHATVALTQAGPAACLPGSVRSLHKQDVMNDVTTSGVMIRDF